jgi:hypothetical protein
MYIRTRSSVVGRGTKLLLLDVVIGVSTDLIPSATL